MMAARHGTHQDRIGAVESDTRDCGTRIAISSIERPICAASTGDATLIARRLAGMSAWNGPGVFSLSSADVGEGGAGSTELFGSRFSVSVGKSAGPP